MKKAHFTDSQILAILKQAESSVPIPELCREHGMSNSTFYKWRSKYGGMDASLMISETCYRYTPKLSDENKEIAALLLDLSQWQRNWGVWFMFFTFTQC